MKNTKTTLKHLLQDYITFFESSGIQNKGRTVACERWIKLVGHLEVSEIVSLEAFQELHLAALSLRKQENVNRNDGSIISASTYNKHLTALSAAFTKAKQGFLGAKWVTIAHTNPIPSLPRLPEVPTPRRALSIKEIKKLFKACRQSNNPWLYYFVRLAYLTGRRKGELLAIHTNMIDKERMIITIPANATKAKKSHSVIPIIDDELLTFFKFKMAQGGYVFSATSDKNKRINPTKALRNAFDRAGLYDADLHCLRHTVCTMLTESGRDDAWLYVGHTSPRMMSRYVHQRAEKLIQHQAILINDLA